MSIMILDTGNLYFNINKRFNGKRINYDNILKKMEIEPKIKIAYGAYRSENRNALSFITALNKLDFITKFKVLTTEKYYEPLCDIVIDVYENMPLSTVVFGSSNLQLIPLIYKLKEKDVTVHIIGCNIPKAFHTVADNIIEINEEFIIK